MIQQGHDPKVHAEYPGDQVQRQEDGRDGGEHQHDVVGAVALCAEVNLHGCFCRLLHALGVAQHPVDMLHHIAGAGTELVLPHQGLSRIGMKGFQRLLAQGFQPFLNGIMLFIAQLLQQTQLAAGFHQPFPLGKAHMGIEQIGLPVFDLGVQGLADFEVAIDHDVAHAQRQVSRTNG